MNRRSPGLSISSQPTKRSKKKHRIGLPVAQAIPGFIQYKRAEGLSPNSLTSYAHDLNLWLGIAGDRSIQQVTSQELRKYLNYMLAEYTPRKTNVIPSTHSGQALGGVKDLDSSLRSMTDQKRIICH